MFRRSPIHPLTVTGGCRSVCFDSRVWRDRAEPSVFVTVALETTSLRHDPLGGRAENTVPAFGNLHPAKETRVKVGGLEDARNCRGHPAPTRSWLESVAPGERPVAVQGVASVGGDRKESGGCAPAARAGRRFPIALSNLVAGGAMPIRPLAVSVRHSLRLQVASSCLWRTRRQALRRRLTAAGSELNPLWRRVC